MGRLANGDKRKIVQAHAARRSDATIKLRAKVARDIALNVRLLDEAFMFVRLLAPHRGPEGNFILSVADFVGILSKIEEVTATSPLSSLSDLNLPSVRGEAGVLVCYLYV